MIPSTIFTMSPPGSEDLREIMSWFATLDQALAWSGPGIRYPWTEPTFRADARIDELPSQCLRRGRSLLGFGQYYERLGCCHLGRLVIDPERRRQGLAGRLIRGLADRGCRAIGTVECSLFVLSRNHAALTCYQRLGFAVRAYPDQAWLAASVPTEDYGDCLYLRCPIERLRIQ